MQLGFFTMPIHPLGKDWRQTLREDQEAFVLADALGFAEGYVGEHVTDAAENITSSADLHRWLWPERSKRMRLGTGTVNLPNVHPATVAAQIAMLDHLLDGRLNLRHQPGRAAVGRRDLRQPRQRPERHVPRGDRHDPGALERRAAIRPQRQVLERSPRAHADAGDRPGHRSPSRFQRPHPPIVVTAVAPFSKGVTAAAARGWEPISANFLHAAVGRDASGRTTRKAARQGGRDRRPRELARGQERLRRRRSHCRRATTRCGPDSPYRYYYRQLLTKLVKNGRVEPLQGGPDHARRGRHPRLRDATSW